MMHIQASRREGMRHAHFHVSLCTPGMAATYVIITNDLFPHSSEINSSCDSAKFSTL
ncbi:hypothetical protein NIES2100_69270 [Calothrix sp. NIES-2100]|nr:hypothetical protein NIES2100_69270 [Calothrix sp. NIES-2100]